MKKTIIALAVASAASLGSVAQADNTTLYGSVRMGIEHARVSNTPLPRTLSGTAVTNAASRFGIRGSDDLGNGLSAIYQFEFGANNVGGAGGIGNRLANVGLSGGFGTVTLGRQWTPYYNVVGGNGSDIFNGSYSWGNTLFSTMGIGARQGNVVSYVTPDMGGFSASLALVADGRTNTATDKAHIDATNVAFEYANNGIYAGLTYLKASGNDTSFFGGSVSYTNDTFKIGLSAERANIGRNANNITGGWGSAAVSGVNRNSTLGQKPYDVALFGEYYIDESNTIRASLSTFRTRNATEDKANQYAIGYEHSFSPRTLVWAEYEYVDYDFSTPAANDGKSNTISVGLRTDF